jgi:2-polyprenyl-6-methoxyphenol hydroxylase-like FAD-dependent oxidoreductase
MTDQSPFHAIVLGGSVAGLFAARVLADHAEHVTLVERDELPGSIEHRKGTPQSRHANNLLPRALRFLEAQFPGITEELEQVGAIRVTDDARAIIRGVRFARTRGAPTVLCLTRPLLDAVLRRRVRALRNVELRTGCDVKGLVADGSSKVAGVKLGSGQGETSLSAELVVDTMGRGTRARHWLAEWGYPEPNATEVRANVRYASRLFSRAPEDLQGDRLMIIGPTAHVERGAAVFAVEQDRWLVTLFAYGGEAPPTELSGFRAFARTLVANDLGDLLARATALDEGSSYVYPSACLRRFDQLRELPDGYVCLGDALCHLNPSYGSGMTSAALQAESLALALTRGRRSLPRRYYKLAVKAAALPFELTWAADLDLPSVVAPPAPTPAPIRAYLARAMRVAGHDPVVALALRRIMGFLDPPPTLLRPSIAVRVLFGNAELPPIDASTLQNVPSAPSA